MGCAAECTCSLCRCRRKRQSLGSEEASSDEIQRETPLCSGFWEGELAALQGQPWILFALGHVHRFCLSGMFFGRIRCVVGYVGSVLPPASPLEGELRGEGSGVAVRSLEEPPSVSRLILNTLLFHLPSCRTRRACSVGPGRREPDASPMARPWVPRDLRWPPQREGRAWGCWTRLRPPGAGRSIAVVLRRSCSPAAAPVLPRPG